MARLLVVDDNPVNLRLLQAILQREGHHVATAINGAEALQVFMTHRPHGVFMDLMMPVMDGYEATRRIREAGSQVPIIAVTADTLIGSRDRATQAGCNDYITKPFTKQQILKALTAHLVDGDRTPPPLVAVGGPVPAL